MVGQVVGELKFTASVLIPSRSWFFAEICEQSSGERSFSSRCLDEDCGLCYVLQVKGRVLSPLGRKTIFSRSSPVVSRAGLIVQIFLGEKHVCFE